MDRFQARLFIQGTGVYLPHTHGDRVLVLFPDGERAYRLGLRDPTDPARRICPHKAVVQHDARNLSSSASAEWRTLCCRGRWIDVESDSDVQIGLQDQKIPGVPLLEEVAETAGLSLGDAVRADLLDGTAEVAELLAAGLYLDRGVLSPSSEYQGAWKFRGPAGRRRPTEYYSSVMKVELGLVSHFTLRLWSFGDAPTETLALHPIGDELDVWIRHSCRVDQRPMAEDDACELAKPDVDFALNFALAERFTDNLAQNARLPVPEPVRSWGKGEEGGAIGGDCRRCMCGGAGGKNFDRPY